MTARAGATLLLGAIACGKKDGGGVQVDRIQVDPTDAEMSIGESLQLTATPVDADGNVVVRAGAPEWVSKAPTVATVDASSGLVTALATGSAVIEVTIARKTGNVPITVRRRAVELVAVEPGNASLSRGGTRQYTARTFVEGGGEVTDRAVAWVSSNPGVATVVPSGRTVTVTAVAPGTATIRATSEAESGEGVVVVDPDPVMALSSQTASFTGARTGADPTPVEIQVSNVGGGTLQGLASQVQFVGTAGWLTAQLSSTMAISDPSMHDGEGAGLLAPATLTLRVTIGALAEGVFRATVTVSTTSPQVISRQVAVTLTVGPGPSIAVAPNPVAFTAFAGGASPSPRTATVSNGGGGTLSGLSLGTITYGPGAANWLAAVISGATAPAQITLTPTLGTIGIGSFAATVPVRSSLAGVAAVNLQVTLTVSLGPVITLSATSVTFVGAVGGTNPASKTVTVTNTGGGVLDGLSLGNIVYGAGASGWLSQAIDKPSATATVTLQPSLAGLPEGAFNATVEVRSSIAGVASKTLTVTLTVVNAAVINLSTNAVTFTQVSGQSPPAARQVSVTAGGTTALTGLNIGAITFQGGPTGWLTASLSSATAPATVTLTIIGAAPAIGSYTATVPVQSSLTGVVTANIAVTYNVVSGAVIAVATSATFTALIGASAPPSQALAVTNSGTGSLTGLSVESVVYAAGQATGWLTDASLSGSTAPTNLNLTASHAGLAAGTYNAVVTLASNLFGVSSKTVAVTLTVSPSTTIVLSGSTFTLNAPNGGGNPTSVNVQVTSGSPVALTGLALGSITYSAGASGWLTRSLTSTTAPATLTLGANVAGVVSGTHTAAFDVTSPVATNSPRTITVTLNVPSPTIALSSSGSSITRTQSLVAAFSQSITVSNSGGGVLTGLARSGQPSWLTATLSSTTAPATLTLTVNTGVANGLARGTHVANVQVTGNGATNAPIATITMKLIFTFDTHISPWITSNGSASCAASGCHSGPPTLPRPNLSTTNPVGNDPYTVLFFGTTSGGKEYVTPGDLTNSVVYQRVNSTTAPMPPASVGGRNQNIVNAFFGWILDQAPRR